MKAVLMGTAATVLAALLLTLVIPNRAHAVVAALVQVANSATAPALTLDVSRSASQHIELGCDVGLAADVCTSSVLTSTPYVVPAGQNLVVTSVDILTEKGTGSSVFELFVSSLNEYHVWTVPNDGLTHVYQYPSGIVFPAGYSFSFADAVFGSGRLYLDGFLTAN